jgi:hypothetical protein
MKLRAMILLRTQEVNARPDRDSIHCTVLGANLIPFRHARKFVDYQLLELDRKSKQTRKKGRGW